MNINENNNEGRITPYSIYKENELFENKNKIDLISLFN